MGFSEIRLRGAVAADAGDISSCVRRAYQHFEARMGCPPAPMLQDYRQTIARERVWVALVDGQVMGVLVLSKTAEGMFVENVAVDPRVQGHGVGKALLLHAEQVARDERHVEIRLYTNVLMVENRVLYGRFGYQEYDTRLQDGYCRVYMRKALSPPC